MRLQGAIACFLVLFGAAELLEWLNQRNLPLPILVIGGACLAVVSNYSKLPIDRILEKLPRSMVDPVDGE